jgi:hypothetical protein
MIEELSQLAESVATRLSRRGFLHRVGGLSGALVGALAGLVAFPTAARAREQQCCVYVCPIGPIGGSRYLYVCPGSLPCASTAGDCSLVSQGTVRSCHQCM